jgi:CubicO group peptidase (beta-lactamase class C family)
VKTLTPALLSLALLSPPAFAAPKEPMPWAAGFVHLSLGEKEIHHESFGQSRVTARAPFPIASLSKHFTASLVRRLIEQGKLKADTPIRQLIPELVDAEVTVADLLRHRAGIDDYEQNSSDLDSLGYFNCPDLQRFVSLKPTQQFRYSNIGYCLLARGLENLTGRPFSALLEAEVFRPAGLRESFSAETTSSHPELLGYAPIVADPNRYRPAKPENFFGSAGIISTPDDLKQWRKSLRGFFSQEELSSFRQRLEQNERVYAYEWGLEMTLHNGRLLLSHTGKIEGHSSFLAYYPEIDLYFFALIDAELEAEISMISLFYLNQRWEELTGSPPERRRR